MGEQDLVEIVHVRNVRNGRVHNAYRRRGEAAIATYEGDNLDGADHLALLTDIEFSDVEPDDLCVRCFGTVG